MSLNTVNVPPRRTVESNTTYVAVSNVDRSDRLLIVADTEAHAKIELIDKLGYRVQQVDQGRFYLIDVETDETKAQLDSKTLEAALDEVLTAARWKIIESMDMVGGSLGQGFEEVDDE